MRNLASKILKSVKWDQDNYLPNEFIDGLGIAVPKFEQSENKLLCNPSSKYNCSGNDTD